MANVGSGTSGQTLIGAGNGASPTYKPIGTNSGLSAHGVLIAEGNSAFVAVAPGASNTVLMSNGAAADPIYSTAAYPVTAGTSGNFIQSNGTNFTSATTLGIANGGTNANSMSTSTGIVKYDGTKLVTSSAATLNASNVYNNTAQPSVKAVLTTTASNITGDGTVTTIPFDTVTTNSGFDQASNFNTSTYRFTAPVAGRYLVHCTAYLSGVTAGHNSGTIFILGNNTNNIGQYIFNPGAIRDVNNTCSIAFTQMLTFAANDYIEMRLVVYSGAKTISVGSDNFGLLSWFNIQLVN